MADVVHVGLTDMRGTTGPRLILELIAARMLLPGAEESTGALLQRIERMERRLTLSGDDLATPTAAAPVPAGSAPAPAPVSTAAPAPTPDATPAKPAVAPAKPTAPASRSTRPVEVAQPPVARPAAAPAAKAEETPSAASATPAPAGEVKLPGTVDAAAVRRIWDEVLTYVRRASPRAAAVVREAIVREVDGNTLVLVFKHPFHAQALSGDPKLVIEALTEVIGGRWQIRCEVSGQQPEMAPPMPMASAPAERPAAGGSVATPRAATPAREPVAPPSAAEWGFDDDDEPLDDDDPPAVRQSGEQQAIDLLRQTLGAEKIGEVDTH
jgi:DNA polymerase-3 subunit gamma/tau